MKKLWIVAVDTELYGRVYLPDYAGTFRHDVVRKVMQGDEALPRSLEARLEHLGWEIVCLETREHTHSDEANPSR